MKTVTILIVTLLSAFTATTLSILVVNAPFVGAMRAQGVEMSYVDSLMGAVQVIFVLCLTGLCVTFGTLLYKK